VILRSNEVESERGRMVEALASFIGAGTGSGTGLAWCSAGRAGSGAGRALARSWRVKHVRCVSALVQTLAEIANVRILAKILRRPLPST
jgi:hypothetical protein